MKRSRGRGGRRPQQNNPNRTFDSSGPEIKIRGSAAHVYEKYLQLARDANSSGDRVMAENYLQHAEHYYRILAANQLQQQQYQQSQNGGQQNGQQQQPYPQQGNGNPNGNGNGNGQNYGNQQPPVSNATFSLTDNGADGDDDGDEMGPE
ncbi:MAG TPA: DUF4167 domain-containing protein [Rhizomicrobium sp.]|nr:DUF4167 domain-containing protein [Rhizomicrobium sp.]